jgi:hypothetical protein
MRIPVSQRRPAWTGRSPYVTTKISLMSIAEVSSATGIVTRGCLQTGSPDEDPIEAGTPATRSAGGFLCSRERRVYSEIYRRELSLRPLPHYFEGGFEMARIMRGVEQGRRVMIAQKLRSYRGEP